MGKNGNEKEFVDGLKSRFEHLKSERAKWEADWNEAQRLVAPSARSWSDPRDKKPARPKRFTSRPTNYLETMRSGITGYSVSPNIAWLKLGFEDAGHAERHGAKDWLEAVEKTLYAEFSRSNLYKQVSRFVENAACYGHAVMLADERLGAGRARFTTLDTRELYLDINEFDEVDAVFRRHSMTLGNAASFFGEEKLCEERRLELEDRKNLNNEMVILHAVYKREDFDPESPAARDMPYASVYLDEERDRLIEESGYAEFPFAVFLWDQASGAAYGDSPAIQALDDIRLLNIVDECRIKICEMSAEPPLNVPDTMKETVNVVPAGFNYYTDPKEIITPIQTGVNFPVTLEINREMENRARDWFHVDFFLALMRENPGNVTATYVMELQGEKAAVLSDMVVGLNGALGQIIRRTFNILWRQRRLPMPPESLRGSGAEMKIDFMGPLAQAQKKHHESAGIAGGMQLIGAVAKIFPEALDTIDFDQTLKSGLEGLGFPQIAVREDRDIKALRAARARQQAMMAQQQQAMEQQKNLLGNYGKLNEPVQAGSAIEQMEQMQGGFNQ